MRKAAIWITCVISLAACGDTSHVDSNIYVPPHIQVSYSVEIVNGTPVWTPSQATLPAGAVIHATLSNSLLETHHFRVAGVTDSIPVDPNQTTTTDFAVPGATGKLAVYCTLHDPNQTGTHQTISNSDQ